MAKDALQFSRQIVARHAFGEHFEELRHRSPKHVLLAAEMLVEGGTGDAGSRDDALNRNILEAIPEDQCGEGTEDRGPRALAAAVDGYSHTASNRTNAGECPLGPHFVEPPISEPQNPP